jgi:hypothetical protein
MRCAHRQASRRRRVGVVIVWVLGAIALVIVPMLQQIGRDMLILVASAIDRFDESPEMQVSSLLGHVPDRGLDDATGDGGRGEASPD